ncbi:hypothetical protein HJC99_03630 [Candidatus Saccharibacteria bacterium]|nr:hypothetical protein [Candidatus Saccharibacteria bacterium]
MSKVRALISLIVGLALLCGCSTTEANKIVAGASKAIVAVTSQVGHEVDNGCINPQVPLAARICFDYSGKSSTLGRWAFYKFGTSTNASVAGHAKSLLEDGYTGPALAAIVAQVSGWPHDVSSSPPNITITKIVVNQAQTGATLHTVETWKVTTTGPNPTVLFAETKKAHVVTMVAFSSSLLDSWKVKAIA